jgi:ribonuclease P protein component
LVVYAYPPGASPPTSESVVSSAATHGPVAITRVGFIVGRNVGGAVVRNRVRRRLRHLLRDRVGVLAPGTLIVVRALAPAAGASSAELANDVDSALRKLQLIAGAA